LAQCFVEENHTADIAFNPFGCEKDFAVTSAIFFGGLDLDRIEALFDRGIAFIRRQHAFLFRDDCFCYRTEFIDIHS
jgi:hypothetical protein